MADHEHEAQPLPQWRVLSASVDLRQETCACGAVRMWTLKGIWPVEDAGEGP